MFHLVGLRRNCSRRDVGVVCELELFLRHQAAQQEPLLVPTLPFPTLPFPALPFLTARFPAAPFLTVRFPALPFPHHSRSKLVWFLLFLAFLLSDVVISSNQS